MSNRTQEKPWRIGLAMAGLVSDYDPQTKANGAFIPAYQYPEIAKCAVDLADELLKALEK